MSNVVNTLLAIIAAALTRGADYATRLIAAYDATATVADGGVLKYIVRASSMAKDGTVTVYVNRHVRVGKAGERTDRVAELKHATVADASAWLVRQCARLDTAKGVARRTGRATVGTELPDEVFGSETPADAAQAAAEATVQTPYPVTPKAQAKPQASK